MVRSLVVGKRVVFCLLLLLMLMASPALAQELFVNGGVIRNSQLRDTEGQWSVMYRQAYGAHGAFSLSYLNEAHRTNNHRDSLSAQIWGRTALRDLPLWLALGIGPSVYFDTRLNPDSATYRNVHGLGILSSATATWHELSPWLLQVRIDYATNRATYDTLSVTAGIGYLLAASPLPGSMTQPARGEHATDNEITLYLGPRVLNSDDSEHSFAGGLEYRRSLGTYLAWTIAFLHEGDTRPLSRYGIATQLWAVQSFFDGRLELGIGAGPYAARDRNGDGEGQATTTIAGDVSLTAAYRVHPRLALRATWSRIVTDYSRDTDLFLGGVAYRF
ncbi:MAG: hypothetical protein ACYC7J_03690 [Syntrophales bacterium]